MTTGVREYAFRPWVRSTCVKAMLWGVGAVAVFGLVAWWMREPGAAPVARAFGVLVLYSVLFLASLAKIWWTAGRPAVVLDDDGLAYQPLHLFRPRRIPWRRVLAAAPKEGTRSYRLAFERSPGRGRELFLNLAVVAESHALVADLGRRLEAAGLEPDATGSSWRRPGWDETG